MKYWLLTTEYPPQFGGGIGTYCEQWAHILERKGNDVTVFLPNRSVNTIRSTSSNKIRIVEFSPYLSGTSAFLGYEAAQSASFAEIIKIFAEKEGIPDWLEAQEYNGIAYYTLHRKHLGEKIFKDLRIIITCHAPSFLYFEYNHINPYQLPYFWIGEMEKYCIQASDVCISPSQYLIDCLKERHPFDKEIHVLHNPFSYNAVELNCSTDNTAIFLAKLSPSKGILQTLKAFKYLWEAGYDHKLKLIGDKFYYYHAKQCMMGDYVKKYYGQYIEKGLLELVGAISPEGVKQEIQAAKIVLVPSTVDNFPYTVLEAMASKKVVIASSQGGHKEIIKDRHNGFLFDHSYPETFRDKIIEAFQINNEELEKIVEAASNTVSEKCDPEAYYVSKIKILESFSRTSPSINEYAFTRKSNAVSDCNKLEGSSNFHEEKGLLSVVIPFYNMGNWLTDTINSIYHSSYKNIEIIIVNDGSDDAASLSVLKEFASVENIRIVSQQNKGLADARNAGAMEAKGEFLAFLDADDMVHPEYYSRSIEILEAKSNVYFIGSWVQYIEGANNIWPTFNPEPPYLLYHNMVNSSGLVYKRKAFLDAGFNDRRFVYGMEDYDSVISMVKHGYRGVVIPEPLFLYRVRKESMSRSFNASNQSYLYQLLADKHKELYSEYAPEVTNLLNANGPGYSIENPTLDHNLLSSKFRSRYINKLYIIIKQQPLIRRIALKALNLIN